MFEKFVEKYEAYQSGQAGSPDPDPFDYLSWIEADQNPFKVRILDCRSVALSMISTAAQFKVVASFSQLRQSTGEQHIGKVPENTLHVPCSLHYPQGASADGPLFVAEKMEDKWDIYLYDNHIYFARSWTGQLIFRAAIEFNADETVITAIDADAAMSNTKDMDNIQSLVARQVDYLVLSHLYKAAVPHPIPLDFPNDPREIALYSFSQYGNHALFATYEDFRATIG
jgi:hypothetical protein